MIVQWEGNWEELPRVWQDWCYMDLGETTLVVVTTKGMLDCEIGLWLAGPEIDSIDPILEVLK